MWTSLLKQIHLQECQGNAGALEEERDGGVQTLSHITLTPGCEDGLNRLIAVIMMSFLGIIFVCWNSL